MNFKETANRFSAQLGHFDPHTDPMRLSQPHFLAYVNLPFFVNNYTAMFLLTFLLTDWRKYHLTVVNFEFLEMATPKPNFRHFDQHILITDQPYCEITGWLN